MFLGNRGDGCSDILWLILILACCCGDRGIGGFNGCEDILFLLLILCCCCGNGIGGRRDVCC